MLVYLHEYSWDGGAKKWGINREEGAHPLLVTPTCPYPCLACHTKIWLFLYEPTLLLHLFTVNTRSQPHSPVLYHFTQSSLPLFNWKTFCLLLPNHMMWDKCSNPSLRAFKDCNTTFTRQIFDSKWISYKATVGLHAAAKEQNPRVGFAHKKVNNDTMTHRYENKQNQSVPCRMLVGSMGLMSL